MQFRFGVFELDERARELRRAGRPVPIQPKPFELLRLLLRERHRVVPFDELMQSLWPEETVSPASLNRAVTHARRALGDTGRGSLIKSVPRRGYRFAGRVAEVGGPGEPAVGPEAPGDGDGADGRGGEDARADRDGHARASAEGAGPRPALRGREFVGRREALARLDAAAGRLLSGASGVVLVAGPAGIGKTRLVEVFAERAAGQGIQPVFARGHDGDGFPAFWLWIQVLRALVEEPDLREALVGGAASGELAALAPALQAFAPEAARGFEIPAAALPDLSDEQQRFRFFDAAQRALRACARRRPLLVVLEDVQWVDPGSLRLLEHVALELAASPVLLAITLREEANDRRQRIARTLALLRQQPGFDAIELAGLSRGEVAELLRALLGRPAPVDLVSELYARSEGVPLFLAEAIRLLDARGDLARPGRVPRQGITLPTRVADLIRRSIAGVSPACAEWLGAAAVLGRDFALRVAADVAGIEPEQALDLFDEAVRAGIVEEASEGAVGGRFSHALYQEAIYEDLTSSRRARLHRAAAQRLERQHAAALEPVLSELAHHHHRALAVGDVERAFEIARRAAAQAGRFFAWELAATHYEQAITALDQFEVVDPRLRVEVLLALGEAHRLSGQRERRMAAYEEAVGLARGLGDGALLARAAIGLCDVSEWSARPHPQAGPIVLEAIERVAEDDLGSRARLGTRLAYLHVRERSRAEREARSAVAQARRSGDPLALQDALYVLHYAIAGPDDLAEREQLVAELEAAAAGGAGREVGVIALLDVACDGLMQGDRPKADRHRALAERHAGPHPSPSMSWHLRVWDAGLALLEGRFDAGEQAAHDALLMGQRLGHPFAAACFSGQACTLDRERGRDRALVDRLEGRLDSPIGVSHWAAALLARARRALGDERAAREALDALVAGGRVDIARNIRWNSVVFEIAMLAAELEAAEYARPLLEALATAREQHALLPIPIVYAGPFTRAMAALSCVLGLADDALGLYDEALESARALGARPTVARIALESTGLRARSGDLAGAREAARESEALAVALGMKRLAEEARQALARLGPSPAGGVARGGEAV